MIRKLPSIRLSKERRQWFWQQYANLSHIKARVTGRDGKLLFKPNKKWDLDWRGNTPAFVSPHAMGRIRKFDHRSDLLEYIHRVQLVNRRGEQGLFRTFEFQPTQVLLVDRKNWVAVERIYQGPNFAQVLEGNPRKGFGSPFGRRFLRKMQEKGVSLEELRARLSAVKLEIYNDNLFKSIKFDWDPSNILVLDYDPQTKKPLIAFIDHGRPREQKW